ncbi:MAG: serine/threonine-protein kinase [Myxococcota bacterium]
MEIGAYEVEAPLGKGGMAETFVALRRDGGFEQRVCIKRVLPELAADASFMRAFREEARVSAKLRHQNIVQTLDFSTTDEHFLVLELIEGIDLRQALRHGEAVGQPLPAGLIAYIAHELSAALAYAHDCGVIHRDISPSNVLLSEAGEVKLSDFGIAQALGSTRFTTEGMVKGKLPYMAPEYARSGNATPATDIYALGVTLYECVAGQRPFRAKNAVDMLQASLAGEFEPLNTDHAPRELLRIIEGCIDAAPTVRPGSARALLEALESAPPPATARRLLGRHVRALREANAAPVEGDAETELAPYEAGTVALTATPSPAADEVIDAPADAETRTRPRAVLDNDEAAPDATVPATSRWPMATALAVLLLALALAAYLLR